MSLQPVPLLALLLCAALPVRAAVSQGESERPQALRWFDRFEQTLDTTREQVDVSGVFRFKNPGDQTVEWRNLVGSCTCSRVAIRVGERRFELTVKPPRLVEVLAAEGEPKTRTVTAIAVAPGEEGEVEVFVHLEPGGIRRKVSVDIHTTDPATPMVRLKLDCGVPLAVEVEPMLVALGAMQPADSREFHATIRSPLHKDFEILGHEPLPQGMTVRYEKVMQDGMAVWNISGRYGPLEVGKVGAAVGVGGVIRFQTDLPNVKAVALPVTAKVEQGVVATPGFVAFGLVRRDQSKRASVTLHAGDGAALEVAGLRLENLSVPAELVAATSKRSGKDVIVELVLGEGLPAGVLRGELVVQLKHGVVEELRVLFNGFVR